MFNRPCKGRSGSIGARSSCKLLTALIAIAMMAVGCFVLMNESDESEAATEVTIDGIKYSIVNDSAKVIGYTGSPKDLSIPAYAYYSNTNYFVMGISDYAFSNCNSLTSVTLPMYVISIGCEAFANCYSLNTVTFGSSYLSIGTNAFINCVSLTSVTFGKFSFGEQEEVKIGSHAFAGCSSLESFSIGKKVTSIESGIFQGCSSLKTITWGDSLKTIATNAFSGCSVEIVETGNVTTQFYNYFGSSLKKIILGESISSIQLDTMSKCTSLNTIEVAEANAYYCSLDGVLFSKDMTTLMKYPAGKSGLSYTVPDTVESLSPYAFSGCTSLESIVLPEGLTSIGSYSFWDCVGLETMPLPVGLNCIDRYAFYGCSSLTTINIPDTVATLGAYAFMGCSSLTTITLSDAITEIGKSTFYDCTSLNTVILGKNLTAIGNHAFKNCSVLDSLEIPGSVNSIGIGAFQDCISLGSITIPDNVTQISAGTFYGCSSLVSVSIGASVSTINADSFFGCTEVRELTLPISVNAVSSNAKPLFNDCTKIQTIVFTPGDGFGFDYDDNDKSGSTKYYGNTPWYRCRDTITSLVISEGVRSIGSCMFCCSHMSSLELPSTLEKISTDAFNGCSNLELISLPDSLNTLESGAFYGCNSLTSIKIPELVESIGLNAFGDCKSLKSVTLGGSVKTIATAAFYGCESLESIVLPDSVTTISDSLFKNCTALTSVTLGSKVSYIGYSAFSGCTSLISIELPNTVRNIGSGVFDGCKSLESIDIPRSVTSVGDYAFSGCSSLISVSLPQDITTIPRNLFSNCTSLSSMVISESVQSIGANAFKNCTGLIELTLPVSLNAVVSAREPAFEGCTNIQKITFTPGTGSGLNYSTSSSADTYYACTPWYYSKESLTTVVFPDSVTYIGSNTFRECAVLAELILGDSLSSIGTDAFKGCSGLKELTLPISFNAVKSNNAPLFEDSKAIQKITFTPGTGDGYDYTKDTASDIDYYHNTPWNLSRSTLETVVISDSVISIGDYSFYGCSAIKELIMPDSIQSIGIKAFSACSSIKSLTIPEGTTSIEDYAYSYCYSLESINIPDSVTSIGEYAYYGCSSLKSLVLPQGLTSIGDSAFCDCTSLESINLPDAVTSYGMSIFNNCSSLKAISIPSTLVQIPSYMCNGCKSLEVLIIPETVQSLGKNSFANCKGLKELTIPISLNSVVSNGSPAFSSCAKIEKITFTAGSGEGFVYDQWGYSSGTDCYQYTPWSYSRYSLKSMTFSGQISSIGDYMFAGLNSTSIDIPDSVISIGAFAFYSCQSLESVKLPEHMDNIGEGLFKYCKSLKSVTLPTDMRSVMPHMFYECGSLESVNLPSSVVSIDSYAFYKCASLESVRIPETVTSIGDYAFYSCSALTSINIPSGVSSLGADSFSECRLMESINVSESNEDFCSINGVLFTKDGTTLIQYPNGRLDAAYSIPRSVTNLENHAFGGCTALISITIPDTVTNVGKLVFQGCTGLEYIEIPSSISVISEGMFKDCIALKNVILSERTTDIGNEAFYGCSSLASISLPETTSTIGSNAFCGCSKIVSMVIPDSVLSLGAGAFSGCIAITDLTLPISLNAVVSNATPAFNDCRNIQNVTFTFGTGKCFDYFNDSTSSEVRYYGFTPWYLSRDSFVSVTLPEGISYLGRFMFYGCNKLTSVVIPDTVTSVSWYTFFGCSGLKEITLPISLDVVNYNTYPAFKGCTNIEKVTFTGGRGEGYDYGTNTSSGNHYCYYTPWYYSKNTLKTVIILDSVKSIGSNTMVGNKLQTLVISDTVTTIKYRAFADGSGLNSLTVGKSLTSLNSDNFSTLVIFDADGTTRLNRTVENLAGHKFVGTNGHLVKSDATIRFDSCGGSSVPSISGQPGDLVAAPDNPTRERYTFVGWYVDSEYTTEYVFSSLPEGIQIVYAKWEPVLYTITFSDGTVSTPIQYTVESESFNVPDITPLIGKTAEWPKYVLEYDNEQVVNAVYSLIVYHVTFDDGTNQTVRTYTVDNLSVTAPEITTRVHYTASWESYSLDLQDITVHAIYAPIAYSITFSDGTRSTKVDYTCETETITEPQVTKLTGKSGEWEAYEREYTTTQVVNAVYVSGIFKVTFLVDGAVYHTYKKAYEAAVDLPADNPIKQNDAQYSYAFVRWDGYTDGMTVGDGDMEFNAVFSRTLNSYEITFTVDGTSTVSTLVYGTNIVLPAVPAKASTVDTVFTFDRWDGYTDGMTVTGDAEFIAVFRESLREYDIAFRNDDGSSIWSGKIGYGLPIQTPDASKKSTAQYDFVFDKWVDASGNACIIPQTVSGDFTAYASYTENPRQYTLTFAVNGQEFAKYVLYYGNEVIIPAGVPTRDSDADFDYTFAGWSGYETGMKVSGAVTFDAVFSKTVKVVTDLEGNYEVDIADNSASFTAETVSDIVEQARSNTDVTMSVSLGNGVISFDNTALQTLGDEASDLVLNRLEKNQMTAEVNSIVGDNVAYSITFGNNRSFGDGLVTVTVPYDLEEGKDPNKLTIYYIADGRVVEEIPCLYNNGFVTFVTNHFSIYSVMYLDPSPEDSGSGMCSMVIAAAIAMLCSGVAAPVLVRLRP